MAACISAGMSTDQLRTFYRNSGRQMFDKASLFKRLHYSYNKEPLARNCRRSSALPWAPTPPWAARACARC
jgi:hypothetical protein